MVSHEDGGVKYHLVEVGLDGDDDLSDGEEDGADDDLSLTFIRLLPDSYAHITNDPVPSKQP